MDSDWAVKADDQVIICRGWGHHFPQPFDPKRQRVRGSVKPSRDGGYQITQTCSYGCKVKRTMTTQPGGRFGEKVKWDYDYSQALEYKAPKGTRIAPRECKSESMRRAMEYI